MSIIVSAAETQRHKERAAATTKRCGTEQSEVARSIVAAMTQWMCPHAEHRELGAAPISAAGSNLAATTHRLRPHTEQRQLGAAPVNAVASNLAATTHRIRPSPALELRA